MLAIQEESGMLSFLEHAAGNSKDKEGNLLCVIRARNSANKHTSINTIHINNSKVLYERNTGVSIDLEFIRLKLLRNDIMQTLFLNIVNKSEKQNNWNTYMQHRAYMYSQTNKSVQYK